MLQCTSTAVLMHEHQQRGIRPCEVSKRKTDTVRLHYSPNPKLLHTAAPTTTFIWKPLAWDQRYRHSVTPGVWLTFCHKRQQWLRVLLQRSTAAVHTWVPKRPRHPLKLSAHHSPQKTHTSKVIWNVETYITALHDFCSPSKRGMIVHRAPHVAHL